jgi:predicted O-methyltransferase YrrM
MGLPPASQVLPKTFDIIFIDGLHHSDQVIKDISNSLKYLTEGGTIVMHDCLPTSKLMQEIPLRPDHDEWTGDTWKAFVYMRTSNKNLKMVVVDTDYGCGILQKGTQECIEVDQELTFENFQINRNHWMNVISVAEFKQKYLD